MASESSFKGQYHLLQSNPPPSRPKIAGSTTSASDPEGPFPPCAAIFPENRYPVPQQPLRVVLSTYSRLYQVEVAAAGKSLRRTTTPSPCRSHISSVNPAFLPGNAKRTHFRSQVSQSGLDDADAQVV